MRSIGAVLCVMVAMILCSADGSASHEHAAELQAEMPGLTTASDCEMISVSEITACIYELNGDHHQELNGEVLLRHMIRGPLSEAVDEYVACRLEDLSYDRETGTGRCRGVGV